MDVVNNVLLWMHLMGLALGGAASFGIPVVGSRMASAPAEARPQLGGIIKALSGVGRAGLGVLIVTGLLMIWLKYGGAGGFSPWFWAKMVLVVALLGGVIYSGILLKRATSGDAGAAQAAPRVGMFNTAMLVLVVLAAAFAFG